MYTILRHVNCEDLFQWPRLVSGSRRNEVPKGGWSEAELWRSLPTTQCHPIERKKPTLLGRPLLVYMGLHIVFVHVLEQCFVCAPSVHSVLKKFHCLDAVHVCKELAHNPDTVCKSRGVEEIITTST